MFEPLTAPVAYDRTALLQSAPLADADEPSRARGEYIAAPALSLDDVPRRAAHKSSPPFAPCSNSFDR